MYKIIHLSRIMDGGSKYEMGPTDYDPMDLEQALSIVTELSRDAIQSSSTDRWIVKRSD